MASQARSYFIGKHGWRQGGEHGAHEPLGVLEDPSYGT
jgi:hypothetical protein